MCFAPQRRALFQHLNFQKWSEPGVFCTFWLQNVLRATTACNVPSLIWPAASAPAALASLLFEPPEPQIIGKTLFRDFPTFSRICIFFLLTLSLLLFSLLIFLFSLDSFSSTLPSSNLSLLSASALLCFSSVHIVGSLTSKLPSIIEELLIGIMTLSKIRTSADSSDSVLHGEALKTNTVPLIFKILSPCLRLDPVGTECAWVFWA